jgi:small-conductance mechanosensitive channel
MHEVEGGVPQEEPFIRYNAFGDSSINFTVIMKGKEYVDQYLIKHEFIMRLHERYEQEGIEIPFPIRTLHMRDASLTINGVRKQEGQQQAASAAQQSRSN